MLWSRVHLQKIRSHKIHSLWWHLNARQRRQRTVSLGPEVSESGEQTFRVRVSVCHSQDPEAGWHPCALYNFFFFVLVAHGAFQSLLPSCLHRRTVCLADSPWKSLKLFCNCCWSHSCSAVCRLNLLWLRVSFISNYLFNGVLNGQTYLFYSLIDLSLGKVRRALELAQRLFGGIILCAIYKHSSTPTVSQGLRAEFRHLDLWPRPQAPFGSKVLFFMLFSQGLLSPPARKQGSCSPHQASTAWAGPAGQPCLSPNHSSRVYAQLSSSRQITGPTAWSCPKFLTINSPNQGCQTHFLQGLHQPHGCFLRVEYNFRTV